MEPKDKLGEAQGLTERLLDKIEDACKYTYTDNKAPTVAWVYRRYMEQINPIQRVISEKSQGVLLCTFWMHEDDPDQAKALKAKARDAIHADVVDSLKRKPTKTTQSTSTKDNTND
jgi:hypothetical protein